MSILAEILPQHLSLDPVIRCASCMFDQDVEFWEQLGELSIEICVRVTCISEDCLSDG